MARQIKDMDHDLLEEQLKMLRREQLLDCWEDSQHMAIYLDDRDIPDSPNPIRYEQAILYELQLRSIQERILLPGPNTSEQVDRPRT